jgi:two-component system chemotaxis response regulator CheY
MAEILLIDDMKGVRRTVCAVLKRAGHTVTEAEDGGAGIALLQSGQRFDLVITDMLMPKHDGTEVILFLESQSNRPKILAISGGGSNVSSDEAFMLARSKADATLAKPFDNADLIAMVDKLLGHPA